MKYVFCFASCMLMACPSPKDVGPCRAPLAQTQVCSAGTERCGTACTDTKADSKNCGMCGKACAEGQVCAFGTCSAAPASASCNGKLCPDGQSCHNNECTWDMVVACFSSGEIAGLRAEDGQRGPLQAVGKSPTSLQRYGSSLLVGDSLGNQVATAQFSSLQGMSGGISTGQGPNQILADSPYVYSVNAVGHTVQILSPSDAGCHLSEDPGGAMVTVGELDTGANTFPSGVAQSGSTLWVTLNGSSEIQKIDISTRSKPVVAKTISLKSVNLQTFDGGTAEARPWGITELGGKLYAALNNLDAEYKPAGPGLVAVIDPQTDAVETISLGNDCLNASGAFKHGDTLLVSCMGNAEYSLPNYELVGIRSHGVMAINTKTGAQSLWTPKCPEGSTTATCVPMSPSRLAVFKDSVFLGDQNGGRIFVASLSSEGKLKETRGYSSDATKTPIQMCGPGGTGGASNVADIIVP